jgi:predicted alpha/beta hydrolase family esterase
MPRTAGLLVIHDLAVPHARDSLAGLLLVAGERVEIEELDNLHVVALIDPQDLQNPPAEGDER